MYATNSADVCQYIANDCQANIAVVEDQKQLDKFLQVCSVTLSESYTTPAAMLQIRYQ